MGGHVVGSLLVMEVSGITIDNQSGNEVFEVAAHVAVRVFGDNQRGAGVMYKHVAKPLLDIRSLQYLLDLVRYVDRRPTLGLQRNRLLLNHPMILSPAFNSTSNRIAILDESLRRRGHGIIFAGPP